MMCVLPQNDAFPSAQWGYVSASAAVRLSLAARPPLASPVPPSRLRLMPGCGENRNDRSRWRRCPSLCRPGAGSCSRPAPRAAGTAPAGGVTGGAARPRSPPRAAAGPLPPSPGAAAGGRMEQGLSAITLYCAPAAGVMEPEQVSGAGGRLPRRSGRAAGPGRSRFRSGARPRRVRPARGWWLRPEAPGVRGAGGAPGPRCGGGVQWPGRGRGGLSVCPPACPSIQRAVITDSAAGTRVSGVSCSSADNAFDKRAWWILEWDRFPLPSVLSSWRRRGRRSGTAALNYRAARRAPCPAAPRSGLGCALGAVGAAAARSPLVVPFRGLLEGCLF